MTNWIFAPENGAYMQTNQESTINGDLEVPDDVMNGSDEKLHDYICNHWDEI